MNPVVPHLYRWAIVAVGSQDFSALFLSVNPNLGHLPVEFDDHCSEEIWCGKAAISGHLIHHVKAFRNAMSVELLPYNSVILIN